MNGGSSALTGLKHVAIRKVKIVHSVAHPRVLSFATVPRRWAAQTAPWEQEQNSRNPIGIEIVFSAML